MVMTIGRSAYKEDDLVVGFGEKSSVALALAACLAA